MLCLYVIEWFNRSKVAKRSYHLLLKSPNNNAFILYSLTIYIAVTSKVVIVSSIKVSLNMILVPSSISIVPYTTEEEDVDLKPTAIIYFFGIKNLKAIILIVSG